MIEIAKPDNLNPTILWQQMKDAGLTDTNWMYADPDEVGMGTIIRFLDLEESDRATVESVFSSHSAAATAEEVRIVEYATNENTIRDQVQNALVSNKDDIATNNTFLAIASPTNAQIAAQVRELTRQSTRQAKQINGVIRKIFERYESVD